ncbi:MAG: hypothetical protein JWM05_1323, partial [Acidimicrobiales bacterium]|nr:hypothetical protein [Acidimicrobiales bacterium]
MRVLDTVAAAGHGHGADFAGLVAIVAGLVAGLGIYLDAAGPAGRGAASVVGTLVGAARALAPPLLVGVGILLVRGGRAVDPEADPDDPVVIDHPLAHVVVGSALMVVSGLGLLHLARHAPALDAGRHTLADSAGYLGA